ncbi:Imidazolonepropionase [Daejeonella rubra]|uniref:Imidazolonepropionase n=1 Tax=Daejeonella rubra TaxID=990371 RepID=A0A1G9PPG6_9SPHI|nr:amidohydrolase family protein [Daejeonella rubra]SDL99935.1 Imidazolonepropionase [Daejeonella rubra]
MKSRKIVTCIIIFIIGVSSAFAQFSFDNYALCHLNIVDVNAKRILGDYTIVIQNGKIQNILPSKDYIPNDSVQSIVLRNKFVVPGLIDAHVHFATDPTEERRDNAEKVLREMLLTGITSVRDMAGDARTLSSLSRDALIGDIVAPNLYYSSLMAGKKFFSDPRTIATAQGGVSGKMPYMKAIDSISNMPLEVAQAIGTGASGIKMYANLSNNEVVKIVEEAKRQNIPVWSHASLQLTKPSVIIASGVIAISHANMLVYENDQNEDLIKFWSNHKPDGDEKEFWDKEFEKLDFAELYKLMIKYNVVLDATISVLKIQKNDPRRVWVYEIGKRIIQQAHKAGVLIGAGSDSDQETFVQHEMKLLVNECGFTPLEAIIAATKYSAMATGILNQEGSIEIGKKANLFFLNSDPTKNINNIDDVLWVIKNGKLYNPK